tara:strand:- start:4476 stop:5195 length:720 start_codon:yes stop_codon:yes gene_type:complete
MLNAGIYLGFGTLIIVGLLELKNKNNVKNIISYYGRQKYLEAWYHTIINSIVFGPMVYQIVSENFLDSQNHPKKDPIVTSTVHISFIIVIHSGGYWYAHSLMHTRFLWSIHRFHHTYSNYVTPVVAMAVSPMEYILAYMLPFIVASWAVRPSHLELLISAGIISLCNLIIHSPSLDYLSKYIPIWWISPEKHLTHHKRSDKSHLSAPTFDIDYLIERKNLFFTYNGVDTKNDTNAIRGT